MGFEPMTLRDLVRGSYHCTELLETLSARGQGPNLLNRITRLHGQVMTVAHKNSLTASRCLTKVKQTSKVSI